MNTQEKVPGILGNALDNPDMTIQEYVIRYEKGTDAARGLLWRLYSDKVTYNLSHVTAAVYFADKKKAASISPEEKHRYVSEIKNIEGLQDRLRTICSRQISGAYGYMIKQFVFENRSRADIARQLGITDYEIGKMFNIFYQSIHKSGYLGYLMGNTPCPDDRLLISDKNLTPEILDILVKANIVKGYTVKYVFRNSNSIDDAMKVMRLLSSVSDTKLVAVLDALNRLGYLEFNATPKLKSQFRDLGNGNIYFSVNSCDIDKVNSELKKFLVDNVFGKGLVLKNLVKLSGSYDMVTNYQMIVEG